MEAPGGTGHRCNAGTTAPGPRSANQGLVASALAPVAYVSLKPAEVRSGLARLGAAPDVAFGW